ncbi:MAG: SgcJ/EcaC family oxidoreductase [Rhizomicrobium sp.]
MSTPTETSDRAAVEALIRAEDDAWGRGDAAAFSKAVQADAVFTNIFGQVFVGHDAFEAQHAVIFATIYKGTTLRQTIGHLRFLRPDVAAVDTEVVVSGLARLPPGVHSPDGALHTRLMQVLVKEQGAWWIAAYHNVDLKPPPGPPPA